MDAEITLLWCRSSSGRSQEVGYCSLHIYEAASLEAAEDGGGQCSRYVREETHEETKSADQELAAIHDFRNP